MTRPRSEHPWRRSAAVRHPAPVREAAVRRYVEGGISLRQVSQETGLDPETVGRYVRDAGHQIRRGDQ